MNDAILPMRGFTLLELIVTLALSSLLLGGVALLAGSHARTHLDAVAHARLLDARIEIEHEIRTLADRASTTAFTNDQVAFRTADGIVTVSVQGSTATARSAGASVALHDASVRTVSLAILPSAVPPGTREVRIVLASFGFARDRYATSSVLLYE